MYSGRIYNLGTRSEHVTVEALADSGGSVMIVSYDLAGRINMQVKKPANASLKDASGNDMDITGKGILVVQEEHGFPHKFKVLVSMSLMQEELVVGFEDLKILHILNKDFPKTLPDHRRDSCNSIRGGQWEEEMAAKEEQEKPR